MEIKQLKIFVAVAEGKSMTVVAEAYGLTKSAVSHIVQGMERELRTELFIRSGHMLLTESGNVLLRTAKEVIAAYDRGIEQMQSLRGEVAGDLRIGVGSFVEPVIRKAVARLLRDNPGLSVDAHVYRASTLNQMLKAGAIDVAFTMNTAYEDEGIESVPCIPVRIEAVMSRTHDLARKDKVTFGDLCRYDCIMPSEDRRSLATFHRYFAEDLHQLRNRITINTADGALNMVEEENFITFMTAQHIVNRPHLVAIPIEGLEKELTSNMHYLRDVHLKRSAVELLQQLRDYAIPLAKMTEI